MSIIKIICILNGYIMLIRDSEFNCIHLMIVPGNISHGFSLQKVHSRECVLAFAKYIAVLVPCLSVNWAIIITGIQRPIERCSSGLLN